MSAPFAKRANRLNVSLAEVLTPVCAVPCDSTVLLLNCPNRITYWRARTLFTKEPDTIEWIRSFGKGEVLFDIGANVGSYSLYAALRGTKVFALEPESQNYALLNQNIHLNNLSHTVMALNIALNNQSKLGHLHIQNFVPGAALHNLNSNRDYNKKEFLPVFRQGVLSLTLDDLISQYDLEIPDHLKIDVDGGERSIIDGASKTLAHPKLKSVLIELNIDLAEDQEIIDLLKEKGFSVVRKYHAPMLDKGIFANCYNFTFSRSSVVPLVGESS